MLTKREVLAYTKRLDDLANDVQENWREYGLHKKAAFDFCLQVDTISDRLEKLAGVNKRADVLEQDADEDYLKYYDVGGVIDEGDSDEPYMDHYKDDSDSQFDGPMEGESASDLKNAFEDDWTFIAEDDEDEDDEEDGKEASFDYWDDRTASDYWDDGTRTADYWDDEF